MSRNGVTLVTSVGLVILLHEQLIASVQGAAAGNHEDGRDGRPLAVRDDPGIIPFAPSLLVRPTMSASPDVDLEGAVAMNLNAEQRRALVLLAGGPGGYTKGRLLADGFTVDVLADLVREGLATAQRGTLRVGGRTIGVERYRITDAGRKAIES